jgi:Glyoxalase-like domain
MSFRVANITFDCDDVLKVAAFWSAVTGRTIDEGSSEAFASIGGADSKRDQPAWYFNKVEESKSAKNRLHLDLVNAEPAAVDDLVQLGAKIVERVDWGFHAWTVLEDPEGNEFCVAAKAFEDRNSVDE